MKPIRALVVGIEAYDHPDWNVPGPVTAACAVADWLLGLGESAPLTLDLFLGLRAPLPEDERQAQGQRRDALLARQGKGFRLHERTDLNALDTFIRRDLAKDCAAGTQLVVFWSGHGFTSKRDNDRYFFCSDYDEPLQNRVINASDLLRRLRTHAFSGFDEQIFLADVCGVYDKPAREEREAHEQLGTHQLAYFATPEGEYAHSFDAGGMFTRVALDVLRGLGDRWHEQDELAEKLRTGFKRADVKPFRIWGLRDQEEMTESVAGHGATPAGTVLFRSVHTLLQHDLDVVEREFKPHYLRTVAHLGEPRLAGAQGLVGALRELSSMRDADALQPVPHGLLQFLMRLAREPRLRKPIGLWLDKEARTQQNSRDEIARKLAEEDLQQILMIEVQLNAATREIASFTPHLCTASGSFAQGEGCETQAICGWAEFETSLQALFARFLVDGTFANLQIHFLVDPPLFDRPFFDIPIEPGGSPIATETVVLLRHRQRMVSCDAQLREKWIAYADALRGKKPARIKWLPIHGSAALPGEKGLCYAEFSLPHPVQPGASSCHREKDQLKQLLKLGAPFIYLPHADPGAEGWAAVRNELLGLVKKLPRVDAVADKFRDERIRGSAVARTASLLWDDPLSNPFISTRGADDK